MNAKNLLLLLFIGTFGLSSCEDYIERTYQVNEPVYMSYDELRLKVGTVEAQNIENPGKIYFKDNYIFINEYQKGIHVIDNRDVTNPNIIKFIEIPGNVDMAIQGNYLYADSYVDLVTLDLSDMNNISEVNRIENLLPYLLPQIETGQIANIDESKGVVIGYTLKEHTERFDEQVYYDFFWGYQEDVAMVTDAAMNASNSGTGGSMARFTLSQEYLYIVDEATLKVLDVSQAMEPELGQSINIGWGIETIFPYQNKLFIGSQSQMLVYSIENPESPQFISEFTHVTACDPVVVENNMAYVTLRGGNWCGNWESRLEVIDISYIEYPKQIASYPMTEPYGLGIDNNTLFVCDGNDGLKVYNASNPYEISQNMLANYRDINAYDVIPLGDVLLMIGADGFYQFDYSDVENMSLLSYIPVTK